MRFDQTNKPDALNVLIVDDTTANLKLLTEILADDGYIVRPATNGELALRSVKAKLPAIILLDVRMPDMDGYEVCRRLKADINTSQVPVIFISALDDEHSKVKGFEVGGVDFITKPFRKEEVLARVKTHINLRNIQLELELQKNRLVEEIEERRLAQEKLNESEEQFRTTLYGIGDGVITTDSQGNVRLLNQVAENLTGWKQEEAQGKVLEEVFNIINEYSRKPVEIPIRKVLREGVVVGLANHTLLIARDGTERAIADSGAPIRNTKEEITGVVLVFRDQTEERKAENILKQSEERFRNIFEHSPIGMSMTKVDGTLHVNQTFCDMLGYTEAELVNKHWTEISHKDDEQMTKDVVTDLLAGKFEIIRFEKRYIHKNGSIVWTDVSTFLQRDKDSNPQYFITSVSNITARAEAEAIIQKNEKKFRALIENNSDAISLVDANGQVLYDSNSYQRMLGYTGPERLSKSTFELVHPEDQALLTELFGQLLKEKGAIDIPPTRVRHNNGNWIWIEGIANNLLAEPEVGAIVINFRDITERKLMEDQLRISERQYRTLFEQASDGIFIADQQGNYIDVNSFGCDMLGYKREELLKINIKDIIGREAEAKDPIRYKELRENPVVTAERKLKRKDGSLLDVEISGKMLDDGRFQGIVRDITERKHAEQLLRESEEKFRELAESTPIAISIYQDDRLVYANKAIEELSGYNMDEYGHLNIWDFVAPEYQEFIRKNAQTRLMGLGSPEGYEFRIIRKDGLSRWVYLQGSLIKYNRRPAGLISVLDITHKKQMEDELLQSEERFRKAITEAPFPIMIHADDDQVVAISRGWTEMSGYEKSDIPTTREWTKLAYGEEQSTVKSYIDSLYKIDHWIDEGEYSIHAKCGEQRIWDFSSSPLGQVSDGRRLVISMAKDVTDRKKAESELLEANQKMDAFFNQSLDGFFFMMLDEPIKWNEQADKDSLLDYAFSHQRITKINQAMLNQYGAKSDDFIEMTPSNFFAHDLVQGKREWRKLFDQGKLHTETDERKLNGEQVFIEGDYICLYDVQGRITGHFGIQRDITQTKKAITDLEDSEKKFRTLIESSNDGISLLDLQGNILFANPRKVEMIGAASFHELIGRNANSMLTTEYQLIFSMLSNEFMSKGYLRNVEAEVVRMDGSTFWGEFNFSLVTDNNNQPAYIMDSMKDVTERKEAEEKLRQSENELKRAQQVARVGNWIWNIKDGSLVWSDEMYRIFGVDKNSFSGNLNEVIQSRIHPDDQEKVYNGNLSVINESKPVPLEYRLVWPDQSVHTVWAEAGNLELDKDGKSHYLRGIVQDISEQKRSMAVIESERKLLRTLIDNLPDSIFIKDTNCRKVAANKTDIERMGLTSEADVVGKTDLEIYDGEIGLRGYSDDLAVIHTGNPILNKEQSFDDKHGGIRWSLVSKFPLFDQIDKIYGLVGIGRDITAQKKANETIQKLTESIEQSPSTIVITDVFGTIEYVNPKFSEITGYSKEEAIGQNPRILKSDKMSDEVYIDLWETISSGNVWRGEFLNRKKNGVLYWEWATMTSIKNELGVITNYIAIKEDISLRKQMESDLIIAKDKAEESDRLKSAFLANMSHEIRTPLNSIIGFSELLTDSDFEEDQKNEFILHIINNGNNLLKIISDIMDISKMESCELRIYKSKISVQKFISKVSSQFAIQFEGKSLEFIVDLPVSDDEVVIFADENRLMQVFNNLISNALKFTSKGSVQIGYQSNGEMVEFHIKDTGIGIPVEYHDKIFERFRQVEGADTRKYGGNGLGLAITKNLIDLMGGEIGLESVPGKGSTFYFTIPKLG